VIPEINIFELLTLGGGHGRTDFKTPTYLKVNG